MNIFKRFKNNFLADLPFFLLIPAALWEFLFFCIPLLVMVTMSFVRIGEGSFCSWFTFSNYISVLTPICVKIIIRSSIIASLTAFFCLIIGYPLAYYLACKASIGLRNVLLFLLMLPFWTNFLVLMYSWYFVLERHGLINSILMGLGIIHEPIVMLNSLAAVNIVMCYCYMPFMILPIYVILERLDLTLIEASQDLGANMRQTFFNIIFPLSLPGVITGCLLVFVPAFGDFAIPLFIGGNKYMLVGSFIEHYFLVVRNSSVGAAFTCLSCLVLLFFTLLLRWGIVKKFPHLSEPS